MDENEAAERLFKPGCTVFLVTSREDGLPDARAMAMVGRDGLNTIWMLTGKCSDKYRELCREPRCLLYATAMEDGADYLEVRLWGSMELLDDAEARALAWRDDYLCYFPGGKDDPNLCVLKFSATSGTVQTPAGKRELAL